jgi:hypothetical protein
MIILYFQVCKLVLSVASMQAVLSPLPTNKRMCVVSAAATLAPTLQASAYKSGDVVQTLKKAFLPEDGSTSVTFRSGDELLEFLGSKVSSLYGGTCVPSLWT